MPQLKPPASKGESEPQELPVKTIKAIGMPVLVQVDASNMPPVPVVLYHTPGAVTEDQFSERPVAPQMYFDNLLSKSEPPVNELSPVAPTVVPAVVDPSPIVLAPLHRSLAGGVKDVTVNVNLPVSSCPCRNVRNYKPAINNGVGTHPSIQRYRAQG
jgi:hypothetical protein